MRIHAGTTRVVLLTGGYALKFARIRPLKTVLKIIAYCLFQYHRDQLHRVYDQNIFRAFWKYLFAGIYANRSEYQYWHKTKDERCAPILKQYLLGLLVVQPRAEAVTLERVSISRVKNFLRDIELASEKQYGLLNGRCVLIDYAHILMPA